MADQVFFYRLSRKFVDEQFDVPEEAKEVGKKKNGKPFFGPSGAIVWCSPTVDTKRGLLYIGTGENYTDPATTSSDAIQALNLKTAVHRAAATGGAGHPAKKARDHGLAWVASAGLMG